MKNLITTTATIAALFAGSAAFAEGGYVDEYGFIGADAPRVQIMSETKVTNDNATADTQQVTERGNKATLSVTTFVNADASATDLARGR